MPRLTTRLLLLLALLGALWHPLCACGGVLAGSPPRSDDSSCCTSAAQAPRTDPCGQPPGECDCERELVLASTDGDGATVLRLPVLVLAPVLLPTALALTPDAPPARASHAAPPRPPDRCRPLPLRI